MATGEFFFSSYIYIALICDNRLYFLRSIIWWASVKSEDSSIRIQMIFKWTHFSFHSFIYRLQNNQRELNLLSLLQENQFCWQIVVQMDWFRLEIWNVYTFLDFSSFQLLRNLFWLQFRRNFCQKLFKTILF